MSKPKKQKLDRAPTEQLIDHLSTLNDDCILEIFKRFDLDQLCAIAQTCKKLRALAGEHFRRTYPDANIFVGELNGRIEAKSSTRHAKCFSRSVQNLCIKCSSAGKRSDLPIYLQSRFSNALKSITFLGGGFTNRFGNRISNLLQNVKTVTFGTKCASLKEKEAFHENILNQCQRIKQIECYSGYVPTTEHPTLEKIDLFFGGDKVTNKQQTVDKLKRFFQLNSNVKNFSWVFHNESGENVAEYIQSFNECAGNLRKIEFDFISIDNIAATYDSIKRLEERENITDLAISIKKFRRGSPLENVVPEVFASLTKLRQLAILLSWDFAPLLDLVDKFINLKSLKLCGGVQQVPKNKWVRLAQELQQLEDLCVIDFAYNRLLNRGVFSFDFTPFVRFSPKLCKLIVHSKCDLNGDQIALLNDERKKLKGACKLEIKVPSRIYEDLKESILLLNKQNHLVKIV